jgi:hypothetical protein
MEILLHKVPITPLPQKLTGQAADRQNLAPCGMDTRITQTGK